MICDFFLRLFCLACNTVPENWHICVLFTNLLISLSVDSQTSKYHGIIDSLYYYECDKLVIYFWLSCSQWAVYNIGLPVRCVCLAQITTLSMPHAFDGSYTQLQHYNKLRRLGCNVFIAKTEKGKIAIQA